MTRTSQQQLSACILLITLGLATCAEDTPSGRPHIVLVLIDQLRADRMAAYGGAPGIAPNLDRMAAEGFYFRYARAPAPWTYPSVASLMTGLYPSSHSANRASNTKGRWMVPLAEEMKTLAELLGESGYRTAGFVTNPYLKPPSRLNQGFDTWEHDFVKSWAVDPSNDHPQWWLRSSYADSVNPHVIEYARTHTASPDFLYVHYIDVHGPWDFAPWLAANKRSLLNFRQKYEMAVSYIDARVAELFRELNQIYRGNLIFVVTADHGYALEPEDDSSLHKKTKQSLHEFNLRVPLIFAKTRAMSYRGVSRANVSLVDVAPSLLEMAGVPLPERLDGVSLLPLLRAEKAVAAREIFAEVDDAFLSKAVVAGDVKRVRIQRPFRAHYEYDLTDDHYEEAPPLREITVEQEAAFQRLEDAFLAMQSASHAGEAFALDSETVQRFQSLGYID